MTSVVLVDTGGTVVEYVAAEEDPQQVGRHADERVQRCNCCSQQTLASLLTFLLPFALQEAECEVDPDTEGEAEGICEAEEGCDEEQDTQEAEDYPAVIVEEVPGASLDRQQGYSAQVLVYEDEAYLMQDVSDEQEVEAEGEAGETEIFLYLSEIVFNGISLSAIYLKC